MFNKCLQPASELPRNAIFRKCPPFVGRFNKSYWYSRKLKQSVSAEGFKQWAKYDYIIIREQYFKLIPKNRLLDIDTVRLLACCSEMMLY